MTALSLEERITTLEKKVDQLLANGVQGPRQKDWRRTIGMFSGDDVMKRIFDEALKYREKDRERARKRYAKSRRTKK